MGIFNIFNKKEKVEESKAPDLMIPDPVQGGDVNLMAADPINTIQEEPTEAPAPEIVESPGIESQIIEEVKIESEIPIAIAIEQKVNQTPPAPSMNAFDMPVPNPETVPETSNISDETPLNPAEIELTPVAEPQVTSTNLTNKFCPDCGNPNDALNKFCVSCGKEITEE